MNGSMIFIDKMEAPSGFEKCRNSHESLTTINVPGLNQNHHASGFETYSNEKPHFVGAL